MGEHMCEDVYQNHLHNHFPRLLTPSSIQRTLNLNTGDSLPMLKNIIITQQGSIDKQNTIINEHEKEIQTLKTSLSEIKHLLQGRQFINRSVSFEGENEIDLDSVHTTN